MHSPLYAHYRSRPVVQTGMGDCEVLKDDMIAEYGTADFWTVYGVTPNGEEEAIGDFTTGVHAEMVVDCLNEPLVALGRIKEEQEKHFRHHGHGEYLG
jgi:hypothetical protein